MEIILQLLVACVVMGVLDFIWLGYISKKLYQKEIGKLLLGKPNMVPAVIFYLIYIAGVVLFVTSPALNNGSLEYAIFYGFAFGLVAYATYDLTSLAAIRGFSKKVAVIDIVWGALITMTASTVTYLLVNLWI